jgi:hypothetical protein
MATKISDLLQTRIGLEVEKPEPTEPPTPKTEGVELDALSERLDELEESFKNVDEWGLGQSDENDLLTELVEE